MPGGTPRGHAGSDELSGLRERKKPLKGKNPKNASCLKMTAGQRKEKVTERLRKPVSGAVAGGVGPVGEQLTIAFGLELDSFSVTRKDVDFRCLYALKGKRIPGESFPT